MSSKNLRLSVTLIGLFFFSCHTFFSDTEKYKSYRKKNNKTNKEIYQLKLRLIIFMILPLDAVTSFNNNIIIGIFYFAFQILIHSGCDIFPDLCPTTFFAFIL